MSKEIRRGMSIPGLNHQRRPKAEPPSPTVQPGKSGPDRERVSEPASEASGEEHPERSALSDAGGDRREPTSEADDHQRADQREAVTADDDALTLLRSFIDHDIEVDTQEVYSTEGLFGASRLEIVPLLDGAPFKTASGPLAMMAFFWGAREMMAAHGVALSTCFESVYQIASQVSWYTEGLGGPIDCLPPQADDEPRADDAEDLPETAGVGVLAGRMLSAENPKGWTVEQVIEALQGTLRAKQAMRWRYPTDQIMRLLGAARVIQEEAMRSNAKEAEPCEE